MTEIIRLFHPAIVHLPIGFILLAILADSFYMFHRLDTLLWGSAAISAILAVISGLFLSNSLHYEDFGLVLHMWISISVAVITNIVWYFKWNNTGLPKYGYTVINILLVGLLSFTGHKGGELTHGKNYLPLGEPVYVTADINADSLDQKDTLLMYRDFIAPILDAKCTKCHEDGDARGNLNLQLKEGLLSDKYGDPAINPGDIFHSEIFKRINLDPENKKFMPPSGTPLSYYEKRLLEWWIADGASFDENIRNTQIPDDIRSLLFEVYHVNLHPKSFYEKTKIPPLDPSIIDTLLNNEFNVKRLAANNNFIEVTRIGKSDSLTRHQLELLLPAREHITWLDLSATNLNDDLMSVLSEFPNITKLKIQNTNITDEGLVHLSGMTHLSDLNLYGDRITDAGIKHLIVLPKLKKLYIWQTGISEEGAERLRSSISGLEVVGAIK